MLKTAKTFKALSDGTRRKILELLKHKELSAGELAKHFSITKPSLSHHLTILKNADLVFERKEKQFVYYSLNESCVERCWAQFFKKLIRRRA